MTCVRNCLYSAGTFIYARAKIRLRGQDSPARFIPSNPLFLTEDIFGLTPNACYNRTTSFLVKRQNARVSDDVFGLVATEVPQGQNLLRYRKED